MWVWGKIERGGGCWAEAICAVGKREEERVYTVGLKIQVSLRLVREKWEVEMEHWGWRLEFTAARFGLLH